MPLSWVCWNSCNSANPCARLSFFLGLYSTILALKFSNGAAELEYSVTLYNYRALNFAIFSIDVMYFYNKMAGECSPDVTSRSIIDYHNNSITSGIALYSKNRKIISDFHGSSNSVQFPVVTDD